MEGRAKTLSVPRSGYWDILKIHAGQAIIIFLLLVSVAGVSLFLMKKMYEVSADIFIEPKPLTVSNNGYAFIDNDFRQLNNQIEILKSDRVAATADALIREWIKTGKCEACLETYPEIRLKRLSKEAYPATRNYTKWLQNALDIQKKDNANVLNLKFTTEGDPQDLTTVFNLYLAAYKIELANINSDKAKKEYDFLKVQLRKAHHEWENLSEQLKTFKAENRTYDINTQVNQLLSQNNTLDTNISNLDAEIAGLSQQVETSRKQIPASPEYINFMSRLEKDADTAALRNKIIALQSNIAEWGSKLTPEHPRMMAYQEELSRLNTLLQSRLESLGHEYRNLHAKKGNTAIANNSSLEVSLASDIITKRIQLDAMRAKRQTMQGAMEKIQTELTTVPDQQLAFAELQSSYDLAREKTQSFQKRLDEALLMKEVSANFTKVDILKKPEVPSQPVKPDVPKIMVAAALLGILLGLFSVYLKASMDQTLHWPGQLQGVLDDMHRDADDNAMADCTVFTLPALSDKNQFRSLMEKSNFIVPEPYKRVIIHLENMGKKYQMRRLGIIPVTPSVQSNMTTVALGLYLTELSNKMVLIDTDYSKHSVSKLVSSMQLPVSAGISQGPGLSNYLAGEVEDFVDVIYPLGKTVYGSFIPAGQPNEVGGFSFSHKNLIQLENNLSPNYDFVMYSLSSVIQSFDSIAVGRTLDGVILVVHPEVTHMEHFRRTVEELHSVGARIMAVLFQPLNPR